MENKLMNKLEAELAHAGEATLVSPMMLMLEQLRITPDRQLREVEFLFTLKGKPCFPRRELVAVTGKAKSGKTFVTSMLMACCMMHGVLSFKRDGEKPLRMLWYDTEQSDESTQDILRNRIVPMVGEGGEQMVSEMADVFNVRCVEWKDRRDLLTEAVVRCKPDLVVVDGIRDLVSDINDGVLAQEVMEELMHLATEHNCCIVCVLHQNKSGEDRNLRGWIGTELMNKAFEVYSCEKLMPQRIFKLEQTLTRKHDIEQPMYFEVGDDGLPVKASAPMREAGDEYGNESRDNGESLPKLNGRYIVHDKNSAGYWRFDIMRLFHDAMMGAEEIGGKELRQRVMQLSGIVNPFSYNKALTDALEQKVIERHERDGHTVYCPAPF
ncbi:MAG: AAA family ATPase [Prevotella sp.]|nr:AAA family ATPase [Prevotella sp.]